MTRNILLSGCAVFGLMATVAGQIGDPGGGGGDLPGGGGGPIWEIGFPAQAYDHPYDVDLSTSGTAASAEAAYSVLLQVQGETGPQALLGQAGGLSSSELESQATIDCGGGFDVPWFS
jgi:hypothetical protein